MQHWGFLYSSLLLSFSSHLLMLCCSSPVSAITRKEIRFRKIESCRTTVQGRYLLSDDNGHVCNSLSLDPLTQCCPEAGEQFSCQGCKLNTRCCTSYEYCVSCCLNPSRTEKNDIIMVKMGRTATAGTYANVFDFCRGRCRHSSESVVHENSYISDYHHCFSLPSNASGVIQLRRKPNQISVDFAAWANNTKLETRLYGINVLVGRKGESCDSACKLNGQTCVTNKLGILNTCEVLQRYMGCKGACLASADGDQPAEVADDSPKHMNPGACVYSQRQSVLSCNVSHPYSKRLCPCA